MVVVNAAKLDLFLVNTWVTMTSCYDPLEKANSQLLE